MGITPSSSSIGKNDDGGDDGVLAADMDDDGRCRDDGGCFLLKCLRRPFTPMNIGSLERCGSVLPKHMLQVRSNLWHEEHLNGVGSRVRLECL